MLSIAVALAAGLGALLRYAVDVAITARTRGAFPYGTLAVNVSGSFVLGVVVGLAAHHGLGGNAATVLSAGFAGGYTTLSTWAWESLALERSGARAAAVMNILGSLAAGIAAGALGLGLGQL